MTVRILGDWGSTRLRLWLVDGTQVLDHIEGPGIAVQLDNREGVLQQLIAPWRERIGSGAILLCGMAGARNGWIEVPYLPCPATVDAWRGATETLDTGMGAVRIAPGLVGRNFAGAPDVMRGEETQIFGALALAPELAQGDAVIVLPGTHSKWAALRDGAVERFHTVMTGELFGLLRDHSALAALPVEGIAGAGFDDGLDAAEHGAPLAALFAARSRQLVDGQGRAWALDYLSGLLIGGEVAAMRAATGTTAITFVGAAGLLPRYTRAAERFGLVARSLDGDACAIAGLLALSGDPT